MNSCDFKEYDIDELNGDDWNDLKKRYDKLKTPFYAYSDDKDFLGDWADDIDAYFIVYHPDL